MRYSEGSPILPDSTSILKLAMECFLREGYYPISFSWPRKFQETKNPKSSAVSTTVPYVPYAFEDADQYYESYAASSLAITQKKGGWDCFRHLEIMGSGCIPLFLGAKKIPKYTMIHYPKELFSMINRDFRNQSLLPGQRVTKKLLDYANSSMTAEAMCRYFSKLSNFNIESGDTILFVDSKLASEPDYLSVLNFIGLKQLYGDQIECLFDEPDYVYVDTRKEVFELYGRGFGYTKVLTRSRTKMNSVNSPKVLVISNLEWDFSRLDSLKILYPTSEFVLFWGADRPIPTAIKEEALRLTQGILFCREIY